MASGCIVGECYLCKMPVFEDEAKWNDKNNKFKHSYCKTNKELQFEIEHLRKYEGSKYEEKNYLPIYPNSYEVISNIYENK